jgi:hypothetical protein
VLAESLLHREHVDDREDDADIGTSFMNAAKPFASL